MSLFVTIVVLYLSESVMKNKIETESDVHQAAVQVLKHAPWREGYARKTEYRKFLQHPYIVYMHPCLSLIAGCR